MNSREQEHIDSAFRRSCQEVKPTFHDLFWDEAKVMLENSYMDEAFRAVHPAQVTAYRSEYFTHFQESASTLSMEESFRAAAKTTVVTYRSAYWSDVDEALQSEGLHCEYHAAYWSDVKRILDRKDKVTASLKWGVLATLLFLLSFDTHFAEVLTVENQTASIPPEHPIAETTSPRITSSKAANPRTTDPKVTEVTGQLQAVPSPLKTATRPKEKPSQLRQSTVAQANPPLVSSKKNLDNQKIASPEPPVTPSVSQPSSFAQDSESSLAYVSTGWYVPSDQTESKQSPLNNESENVQPKATD